MPRQQPPPPCVTFCRVIVSLRGPGQSPVLPFACCIGLLLSVGRCGRCSCWCRFSSQSPVVGAPGLCWMWRDVPFARQRCPVVGVLGVVLVGCGGGRLTVFAVHTPPETGLSWGSRAGAQQEGQGAKRAVGRSRPCNCRSSTDQGPAASMGPARRSYSHATVRGCVCGGGGGGHEQGGSSTCLAMRVPQRTARPHRAHRAL